MFRAILIILLLSFPGIALAEQINIDKSNHSLTYTDNDGNVKSYVIGVGRRGTDVHGVFTVERKALRPSWTETPHMAHGKKPITIPPGPKNPLGVAKLYLSGPQKFIGLHGTSDESSVGKDVSHGCIRLHHNDILELYRNVPVGTKVIIH